MTSAAIKELTLEVSDGHQYEHRQMLPTLLKIDPLYQRGLNQNKVKKICDNWKRDLVNDPKVSQRSDGTYYVFNGQHTIAAWMIKEGPKTPIDCKVYRGLTWEEEKDLFLEQNGISSDPTTFEKLRTLFNAEDKDVRDMVEGAAEAGVQVTFKTMAPAFARCDAVSALLSMYKTLSRSDYVTALQLITATWQGQKESYYEGFIKGMTLLFKEYNGQFKYSEMRKALERNTPSFYIREAKDMNGRIGARYEKLFVREYNKRRSVNRLGE